MIIFTSTSSKSHSNRLANLPRYIFSIAMLLVAACSDAVTESKSNQPNGQSSVLSEEATKSASTKSDSKPQAGPQTSALKSIFMANFTNAIMGRDRKMTALDGSGSRAFGMRCTPNYVSNSMQDFDIELPADKSDRAHVFTVLTPGGRLYELYTPYGEDVESEDIVIPSQAISWAIASQQSKLSLKVDDISGIEIGKDQPFGIFIEEGDYQFALVSSVQKDLIETNRTEPPVTVYAGCVINFTN